MTDEDDTPPATEALPLDAWHRSHGARMVEFAGYWMPIQYEGILAEHEWTRTSAGLFDVSHMGQLMVTGEGVADALEALLPGDISALKPGRIRYSLLLAEDGGILDDLMVTNVTPNGADVPEYYLVVNGATKWDDIAFLREHLPDAITLTHIDDRGLLALQGPQAAAVLDRRFPDTADTLKFMQGTSRDWKGHAIGIARSGYTGEDGFELSVPVDALPAFADAFVADDAVRPIGLGARDSLRLEAGLPLYGHDLTEASDPVSAGLTFAISKRRRAEGGFHGANRILKLLESGSETQRVGLSLEGRMAAREGAKVFAGEREVGTVTSGGFSPSLNHPIAMAQVESAWAEKDTPLEIEVRNKRLPARVSPLPFLAPKYVR